MKESILLCLLALPPAGADFERPHFEARVLLGGIQERVLGEYPVLAGGRVTARAWRFLDAEVEVSRYPIGGEMSLYPATQGRFGVRAGRRFGGVGVFGKLRPGVPALTKSLHALAGHHVATKVKSSNEGANRFEMHTPQESKETISAGSEASSAILVSASHPEPSGQVDP